MKHIAILDCNNFFVSCERLFRPDLRRKPVIVLSSNDGCVVARSQEVKDIGIPMGVPLFQIKDIIKDKEITTFSSNFTLYRDISNRVMAVLKEPVGTIEQYSIDEAFFDLNVKTEAELMTRLKDIKQSVELKVGVPVSLACAPTKTQAKYANHLAKTSPIGVKVMSDKDWLSLSEEILLKDIWGVGRQLKQTYDKARIFSVADLLKIPSRVIGFNFGVVGVRLQAELAGKVIYPVTTKATIPKSLASTRSFSKTTFDKAVLMEAIAYHVKEIAHDLRQKDLVTNTLTIMIAPSRYSDFGGYSGSVTRNLVEATNETQVLLKIALAIIDELFVAKIPYKKAGVIASNLLPATTLTNSLFSAKTTNANTSNSSIDDLMDNLQATYGRNILQTGRFIKADDWQAKHDFTSPAYTTKWTDIAKVK